MEGNTYDILDTERLIRFGQEASGKDRKEAIMILNHKEAIQYVVDNLAEVAISRRDLLRADLESPDKAAPAYRDFVRTAVRRSVLEWKTFRPDDILVMAAEAGIPDADRQGVVDYVGNEIRGLHEGNVIRYRLRPEDLSALSVT